ncbi:MAG: T9SS type A sorting domain-containing protein [Bacteroidetes bacterium]|nr:T9SS type A sorting domain-containing protein [Bacteroidota bacterium]
MKCLYACYCVLLIVFFSPDALGQNSVPNGNFEGVVNCPSDYSQMGNSSGWRSYHTGTADFLHSCSTSSLVSTPSNAFGYQVPASGNGYAGIYTYLVSTTYKEYIARPITALHQGVTYDVSLSISLSNFSGYTTRDLGIWFYHNGPTATLPGSSSALTVTPQISLYSFGAITDTQNWVRYTTQYTPDSAYDNIVIGGFGSTTTTYPVSTGFGTSPIAGAAYYYIDSVVVKEVKGISYVLPDTAFCAGDTLRLPFYIAGTNYYKAGNTFTLQLSDTSGRFNNATTIGTMYSDTAGTFVWVVPSTLPGANGYRIRILSDNKADTSFVSRTIAIGSVIPAKPLAGSNSPVCEQGTLNLTATCTTPGVHYTWSGPASFSATTAAPTRTGILYAQAGKYIVSAWLFGCRRRDTANVSVTPTIGIVSNTSNSPVCAGDTLKLYGSSSASGTITYSWSGPGNFSSASQNAIITRAQPVTSGDYILTGTYSGCTAKDTVTVLVKPVAANHTASSNTPICSGDSLILVANSTSSGVVYSWTGPSFSSTSKRAVISGAQTGAAGRYIVAYSTGNGCYVKDTVNVVINQSPATVTASSVTPTICSGDTLFLSAATSSSGVTWGWSGPASFIANSRDTFIDAATVAATGRYYATATAANGCFSTDSVDVTIKPLPASLSVSGKKNLCQDSILTLMATASGTGVGYVWSGPAGYTAFTPTITITNIQPSNAGRYIVIASINGCSARDTEMVAVVNTPAAPTPVINTPVCVGQDLKLNAGSAPGNSYIWKGPSGFNSKAPDTLIRKIDSTSAGAYTVRAYNGVCPSRDTSVTVVVIPAPSVYIASSKDSICQGTILTFTATAANAGTSPKYQWVHNNTNIFSGGSVYITSTAANGDSYSCNIISDNTCAVSDTVAGDTIVMRVLPWKVPSVSIAATPVGPYTIGDLVSFQATGVDAGDNPSYQWKLNGANIPGATGNVWRSDSLKDNDRVCVEMTSNYTCPLPAVADGCITVTVITPSSSIASAEVENIRIYPNPVTDELKIEGVDVGTEILIADMLGRIIVHTTATKDIIGISSRAWVSGVYVLQLKVKDVLLLKAHIVKQ